MVNFTELLRNGPKSGHITANYKIYINQVSLFKNSYKLKKFFKSVLDMSLDAKNRIELEKIPPKYQSMFKRNFLRLSFVIYIGKTPKITVL